MAGRRRARALNPCPSCGAKQWKQFEVSGIYRLNHKANCPIGKRTLVANTESEIGKWNSHASTEEQAKGGTMSKDISPDGVPVGETSPEENNMDSVARQLGIFVDSCAKQAEMSKNSFQVLTLVALIRIVIEMIGRDFRVHIKATDKNLWEENYREALKRFLTDAKSGKFNKEQIWETAYSVNPTKKESGEEPSRPDSEQS